MTKTQIKIIERMLSGRGFIGTHGHREVQACRKLAESGILRMVNEHNSTYINSNGRHFAIYEAIYTWS